MPFEPKIHAVTPLQEWPPTDPEHTDAHGRPWWQPMNALSKVVDNRPKPDLTDGQERRVIKIATRIRPIS